MSADVDAAREALLDVPVSMPSVRGVVFQSAVDELIAAVRADERAAIRAEGRRAMTATADAAREALLAAIDSRDDVATLDALAVYVAAIRAEGLDAGCDWCTRPESMHGQDGRCPNRATTHYSRRLAKDAEPVPVHAAAHGQGLRQR